MWSGSSSMRPPSSSYSAFACPISSWAIELVATSSSSIGAMPVHSESQNPMTNSSSATLRISSARASRVSTSRSVLTVTPVKGRLRQVGVVELGDRSARDDPQPMRLAAPPVELARVVHGELLVRGIYVARVDHRIALVLLAEYLPHAFRSRLHAHRRKRTPPLVGTHGSVLPSRGGRVPRGEPAKCSWSERYPSSDRPN